MLLTVYLVPPTSLFRAGESSSSWHVLSSLSSLTPLLLLPCPSDEHTNVNIHQPFITGVSRVCKSIPLSRSVSSEERCCSSLKHIHVDVVCTLNRKPVWIIVSDRNPEYISWDRCCKSKGLKLRIEEVLAAALSNLTLRPSSVILFFANGLATYIYNNL
ncbi:hypothetical protein GLYMA_09G161751v4 [Glycine max]|nr:hypothetical protein GLYMA_09G161751v4 [Glycine max]KAH1043272.1 hypothetical protein GYH30_025223 [Glycine max]